MRTLLIPLVLLSCPVTAQNGLHRIIGSDQGEARAISSERNGLYAVAARWETFSPSAFGTQVACYDPPGTSQWGAVYGSPSPNTYALPNDIESLPSGGFVVVGENAGGASEDSCWFFLLDVLSDMVESLAFSAPVDGTIDASMLDVDVLPNQNIIMAGELDVFDSTGLHQDLIVTNITSGGTVNWTKHIVSDTPNDFLRVGGIAPLPGGGFQLASHSANNGPMLSQFDPNGQLAWTRSYLTSDPDLRTMDPVYTPGFGTRLSIRPVISNSDQVMLTIDVDPNGIPQQAHTYRIAGSIGRMDKGLVLEGRRMLVVGSHERNGDQDMAMFKIDAAGYGWGGRRYGSTGSEGGLSMTLSNGELTLVIGGLGEPGPLQQLQGGGPSQQTYLVQTDTAGVSGGCEDTLTVVTDTLSFVSMPRTLNVTDIGGWAPTSFTKQLEYTEVEVCSELAIAERPAAELSVHPNPATGTVTITGMNGDAWQHRLLDVRGSLVLAWRSQGERTTMDVAGLSEGVYVLHSVHAHGQVSNRVVVAPR